MRFKLSRLIVLICLGVMLLAFSGCVSAQVEFKADGTGSATITVQKQEGITKAAIEDKVNDVIKGVAAQSQGDRITLKSVKENDDGFLITVTFKRLAETNGLGSYRYMSGSEWGSQRVERLLLENYSKAEKFTKGFTNWNGVTFTEISGYSPLNPVLAGSGEKLDPKAFRETDNEYYTEDNVFFTFLNCGLEGVSSIEFSFPGKILFASSNVEIIGDDTVKVTPVKLSTTKNDGESSQTVEVDGFIGYAVFDLQTDFTPFIAGGAIVLVIGGLIALGIFTGAFKKFFAGRTWAHIKRHKVLYAFIAPGFILLAVFNYAPMVGIIVAFKNYDPNYGIFGSEWAGMGGFQHFYTLFTHPGAEFWMILRNTVVIALLKFIFGFPASIILALMINALANGMFKKTVQTISYLPYFVSWVVVSNIVYLFISSDGIVNNILADMGRPTIKFYEETKYWWGLLTGTSIWKTVGWGTIVYLAAITGINSDLYEAASIDGASAWRKLWTVTIPGMMPVIGIQLILSAGNLIKDDFDQIFAMVGGTQTALREVTEVFSSLVYRNLQSGPKAFSSTTAISLVQSVISLAMVLGANAIVKKTDNQGLW